MKTQDDEITELRDMMIGFLEQNTYIQFGERGGKTIVISGLQMSSSHSL